MRVVCGDGKDQITVNQVALLVRTSLRGQKLTADDLRPWAVALGCKKTSAKAIDTAVTWANKIQLMPALKRLWTHQADIILEYYG